MVVAVVVVSSGLNIVNFFWPRSADPATATPAPAAQPPADMSVAPSEEADPAPMPIEVEPMEVEHTIVAGETLWRIAAHYDVTVDALVERNRIQDIDRIYTGTVLIIPLPEEEAR